MFKFRRDRAVVAGVAVLLASLWFGVGARVARADAGSIDADVHKALDNKKFQNVSAAVQGPEVVLTGTVETYAAKEEADNRAHHVKGVKGVENEIQVAGPKVEDAELRDKLAKALSYDRVGYGTTAFNSLSIGVHDGVVTLGGTVYGPPDKASALSLVANTPGVKDIVDNIDVAPVSPMDDRLRVELARVIYGTPQLQKYALDPAKPIRITVVNGNVTLTGVVDSKMDHDVAGIRANTVPGIFKVDNQLQIQPTRASK
jgi:hyperosmotically inducible protein